MYSNVFILVFSLFCIMCSFLESQFQFLFQFWFVKFCYALQALSLIYICALCYWSFPLCCYIHLLVNSKLQWGFCEWSSRLAPDLKWLCALDFLSFSWIHYASIEARNEFKMSSFLYISILLLVHLLHWRLLLSL